MKPMGRPFLGIYFILISCVWLLFFGYSIHAALPFNPVKPPLEHRSEIRAIAPQGWSFFTRNPREEHIVAFKKDSRDEWSALGRPNASPSNLFGLRRTTRAHNIEIGLLAMSLNKRQWTPCKESLNLCMKKIPQAVSLVNHSPAAALCGEIALVKQSPVPWAWSRSKRKVVMPSKAVWLNVSCSSPSQN